MYHVRYINLKIYGLLVLFSFGGALYGVLYGIVYTEFCMVFYTVFCMVLCTVFCVVLCIRRMLLR